jgi:phenylalanyl-tRNA synthetase beta chain
MKVSVNWIRNLNSLYKTSADPMPFGIDDLVNKIGAQLGAVDEVIDLGKKYEGIVVVKVVNCEKHPNADKLSLCFVDDGNVVKEVERNEQGLIQVVCGAPNVKADMLAAWIPPGATVPSTHDKDPFVLEARELRGKLSNGMLASPKELGLGESHEGLLVIDGDVKAGTLFADVYKLDDYIIDIENKMFTHRPDLFGQLGIARELAGIYGHTFKSPSWYKIDSPVPASNAQDSCKLESKNEVPDLVPRFCLLVIKDIKVGPSPTWLQSCLSRIGVKSINNIVDLTNYYTHLSAQPSHAFDYDKVAAKDPGSDCATLNVRLSKKGEKITLLGGKTIELNDGAFVVSTKTQPIALGGVMGGADTEVDENTKNIILEVGTWDMNTIRRTSMAYGLFTDASTRYTKGQSPLQNRAVIAKMAEDVLKHAGGRICGELQDNNNLSEEVLRRGSLHEPVETTLRFISERLGLSLNSDEVRKILTNVEFKVEATGEKLKITAPFWRTDIEIAEDIVEEVGRLYGYDKLPLELPKRDLTPAEVNTMLAFKSRLREILTKTGANEVLTYSFVHGNMLEKAGQNKDLAFKLNNAISPDLQYYRLSLTPSLLEKVHPNVKAGFNEFAIYEINKVHNKEVKDAEEPGIPNEFQRLALIFAADAKIAKKYSGAAFYQARKYLTVLLEELGVLGQVVYVPLVPENYLGATKQKITQYDPFRTASLHIGNVNIGEIGEYNSYVRSSLKLPALCAGFELDISALKVAAKPFGGYKPLNRFPSLEQDITLRKDVKMTYATLADFIQGQLEEAAKKHGYRFDLLPLDIFQKDDDKDHKQTSWRIVLAHPDRTLTTEESNKLLDKIASELKNEFNAERI